MVAVLLLLLMLLHGLSMMFALDVSLAPRADKNERVYFNLGMLAMDDKNIEEAENWFKRAVHLKQDFRSALFNLALLLADDDRPLEAAPFLNQLVKYHPDHIKGLILLGDIYINNIKDLDAAENVMEFSLLLCTSISAVLPLLLSTNCPFSCCRQRWWCFQYPSD